MNLREFALPVEKHAALNPKLWEGDRLKSDVRGALLRIAEDFIEFIGVPVRVLDIVIYGGNVNYNYTSKSDLDLHIIVDTSDVDCDREVEELFDSKRKLYKEKYDIRIHGIEVELYVEDPDNTPVSASYSVQRGQWIKPPNPQVPEWDQAQVEKMTSVWKTVLRSAMKTGDLAVLRSTMQLLRQYRRLGLKQSEGEYSTPNLVFKSLRNDDAIRAVTTLIDRLHDQELSLKGPESV